MRSLLGLNGYVNLGILIQLYYCFFQIWKSINPSLKSQITSIHLFGGYSRQQVNYIYNQICVDMPFEEFYQVYIHLKPQTKLIIDLVDVTLRVE